MTTGEDILRILIFTRHHRLTPFTLFHGTYRKFYFCVKCCHTLCPLTHINIEGHHVLYLTSPNWIYANMFLLSTFSSVHVNISYFYNLHMWINTIFSHADITGSFRASLVVGFHSILRHGGRESFLGNFMINWPNFLYCDWLENRIKNIPVIGWFGLSNESCVKMSK